MGTAALVRPAERSSAALESL
ncbi:hypothetical protein SBA1_980024 [Candidatus Sulfotelmatobacter kueseliae]|uniref:Uncharacterized protein n=1 Tax=Candidatus Sulfotelmatobacter kueseliae TaxID=2042962 RepID=A0A2U3LDM3_9BACT|nr:hypothetical protein SBA1_980024 [Candidatus Sulfotelmatobacter kueseliae]